MFHTILPFILSGDNMNDLVAYSFKDQVLRTQFSKEGEPLFCLADICEVLELTNPSSIATSIKEEFTPEGSKDNLDPLYKEIIETNGGPQRLIFITEPQLYYVLMRSKAKKARPFRQWVVNEVLPAIRKKGYYTLRENKRDTLLRKLEFLKMCLNTENITEEQHAKMLETLCKEYANS